MGKLDWDRISIYSIKKRKSKVKVKDFAKITNKARSFKEFYNSLPNILAVNNIRKLVDEIVSAREKSNPVILMMGAHVIKCGLSRLIIDLIEKGIISAITLNGAGIIHDFEIAFIGGTSESVEENVKHGKFGMVKETAEYINSSIKRGVKKGAGIGESVGRMIEESNFKYKSFSLTGNCVRNSVPCTVHVALGTDVIHQHPSFDGALVGEGSQKDFETFVTLVSNLEGGVILNVGSAVILPEVFLKAVNMARNLGKKLDNFTAANFDQYTHYRPYQNVLTRPLGKRSKGYNFIGHHEFMVPLLFTAIKEVIER